MMKDLLYSDITEKIIGAAFEVHKFLGNGFQEVIYQRAFAHEMQNAGLYFAREIEQDIFYKDLPEPIGTRRADFVVENKILVELKALKELEDVHYKQVSTYLKLSNKKLGILVNFNTDKILNSIKRIVNKFED